MHADVAGRWKVGDLAGETGMSRTSFAGRFKRLAGMAPLEYLTQWRMMVARNALNREDSNLAGIAEDIGTSPTSRSASPSTVCSDAVREATGTAEEQGLLDVRNGASGI
jgi:AraC-like DNA-binding protein